MSSYNFLGLVNDVCGRVNETPLVESDFDSAADFYSTAKEAVNSSIRFLNQEAFEWPFNHTQSSQTLTAGINRYPYPLNCKTVDFDSFRIRRNDTFGNETKLLREVDYEEYLERHIDDEYNTANTSIRAVPLRVFQAPDQHFGIHPVPDKDYKLIFEYYALPVDLLLATDVPTVPQAFRHVIVDGAMYYVYFFRGDIETADRMLQKFEAGIKNMRTIYVNRYDKVRDTRLPEKSYPSAVR